jgi:hypothetical protein
LAIAELDRPHPEGAPRSGSFSSSRDRWKTGEGTGVVVCFDKLRTDTLIGASEMRAFFIAWMLLAVIVTAPILALQFPYLQRIERIRENPATATGVFTGKDCANHASRSYAFEVDGKPYDGGGSSEAGGDCRNVQIGAQIVVHYEMGYPANNSGGDPVAVLRNEIIPVILVALFFPPIIIWRFTSWRARGMKWRWDWS